MTLVEHLSTPAPTRTVVARLRRQAGWQLTLLTAVAATDNIDDLVLITAVVPIVLTFHLSDSLVGLLPLLENVAYTLTAFVIAGLADRFARKPIICAGILGWAICSALSGLAGAFWLFALSRFLIGAIQPCFDGPAASVVTDLYRPQRRGWALGLLNAGNLVGILVGFGVEGVSIELYGYRAVFVGVAVLALLVFGLCARFLGEPQRGATDAQAQVALAVPLRAAWRASLHVIQQEWRAIFADAAQLAGMVGRVAQIAGFYGVAFFYPLLLARFYQVDPGVAASLLGGIVVLAIVGSLVGGLLDGVFQRHMGPAGHFWLAGGCLAGMGMTYLVGLLVGGLPALLVGSALLGLCLGAANPPLGALIGDLHPATRRSSAFAAQLVPAFLLGGLASAGIGALSDALGSLRTASVLFLLLIALLGLGIGISARLVRRRPPAATSVPAVSQESEAARDH